MVSPHSPTLFLSMLETLASLDSQTNNVLTKHGKQQYVNDLTTCCHHSERVQFTACFDDWGHFLHGSVMTDRPDYGSSSVCNEEMSEALILLAG